METWDAIRARRNVRQFEDRPIPPEDLERILEAARRTPSSTNQQGWDFVVVTDRSRRTELARVWRGAGHVAGSAATVALVAPDDPDPKIREGIQYDLGQTFIGEDEARQRGEAIDKAQKRDFTEVDRLRGVLRMPFDEQPEMEHYAKPAPEWGKRLMVSCSS